MNIKAAAPLLFVLVFQGALAVASDTVSSVKNKGVLVVGVRDNEPPFGFKDQDSGKIVGIDVDLSRAVAKKLGVKLRVKAVKASERIPALLDGTIDMIAAKMARSPERVGMVDFSNIYFSTSRRLLMRRKLAENFGALEGEKVATIGKSSSGKAVSTLFPKSVSVPFTDYPAAVEALKNGEVDAVAGDGLILYGLLATLPEGGYAIPDALTFSRQEYSLAVRKGDKGFLALVDQTLDELNRSGKAKKIFDKWLRHRNVGSPEGAPSPEVRAEMASGVVVRRASAQGRFVAMGIKGFFRPDSEVSFYKPQGEFLGKGQVINLYDDEIYIDVGSDLRVSIGDAVMMNYPGPAAVRTVRELQDFLTGVKASVSEETSVRRDEVGQEFKQEKEAREKNQEEIGMRKMELDYMYSDRDYSIVPEFSYSSGYYAGRHFGKRPRQAKSYGGTIPRPAPGNPRVPRPGRLAPGPTPPGLFAPRTTPGNPKPRHPGVGIPSPTPRAPEPLRPKSPERAKPVVERPDPDDAKAGKRAR